MITDVQEYFNAVGDAQREYDQRQATLDAARTAARDTLKRSAHRLVAFIAERAPDTYWDHAETVLRNLPDGAVTANRLREIARDHGIDGYPLDQFVAEAEAAGVFTDTPQDTPNAPVRVSDARRELETWARRIGGGMVTDAHIRDLFAHVDRIVEAETTPVDTPA